MAQPGWPPGYGPSSSTNTGASSGSGMSEWGMPANYNNSQSIGCAQQNAQASTHQATSVNAFSSVPTSQPSFQPPSITYSSSPAPSTGPAPPLPPHSSTSYHDDFLNSVRSWPSHPGRLKTPRDQLLCFFSVCTPLLSTSWPCSCRKLPKSGTHLFLPHRYNKF